MLMVVYKIDTCMKVTFDEPKIGHQQEVSSAQILLNRTGFILSTERKS
jgi:hypothetical protein